MCPLRQDWKRACSVAGAITLCAFVLAGCATTAGLTRSEPVAASSADASAIQVSSADSDLVMARAIAEHEMRRP